MLLCYYILLCLCVSVFLCQCLTLINLGFIVIKDFIKYIIKYFTNFHYVTNIVRVIFINFNTGGGDFCRCFSKSQSSWIWLISVRVFIIMLTLLQLSFQDSKEGSGAPIVLNDQKLVRNVITNLKKIWIYMWVSKS